MRRIVISLTLGLTALTLLTGPTFSQNAPNTAAERRQSLEQQQNAQRQKMLDTEQKAESAALARTAKRKACNQQAKTQGLSVLKRRGFVKECMTK